MKLQKYLLLVCLVTGTSAYGQIKPEETEVWEPEPKVVTPGENGLPPSDAIVLFDGSNFSAWQETKSKQNIQWKLTEGCMEIVANMGSIETKQSFGDIQLHIEWKVPNSDLSGQDRSNSGVFLQGRYEVQILDSYENRTYSNGQAGAVYKQYAPLVNAMNRPGEWQVYDILFTAPKFNEQDSLLVPGYLTLLHNGILIQNHVEIKGSTVWQGYPSYEPHGKAPIILQDHNSPIWFRNIWVREL
ncbi:MAG: DUF1080 domain-containing protein [Reichenbachiella sp.]|uniref:3-keto-disaccharide hydrolase n=1 Tax=Reichenbachiella sp. TaxID=2184521 RepID=UPI0029664EB5|nr:DUF1080 domain-containing protein [Reichenbachiella sp.]MDW3210440.1 DUF1080 domain-containing protein [Reichenbachiella sp.]